MNFTSEAKRELLSALPKTQEEREAAICALLLTSGTLHRDRFEFVSENERVAEYFVRLAEECFSVCPEVKKAALDPKQRKTRLTLACAGEEATRVLRAIGLAHGQCLPVRFAEDERTARAFLRGAFLGSGSCTLPREDAKTGYHLEFVFSDGHVAEEYCTLLLRFELLAKTVERGEKTVVYFKSGDALSDFFSVAGAEAALKTLGRVASQRAISNNENRISNCAAGNADRTAIANTRQVAAFLRLEERGVLAAVPEKLQEAAHARMRFPALSLGELAELLGVSKSCLNHRLRKLMELDTDTENGYD